MGETLDYLNAMEEDGVFDGEFFTDTDGLELEDIENDEDQDEA